MTTVTIPLDKNPDIKDLLVDKSMGAKITLHTSLKSNDGALAVLTVESAEEGDDAETTDENATDTKDSAESAAPANDGASGNPMMGG